MKKFDMNFKKPSKQQLNDLLEYYQAGQYVDAEKLSLSITQEFPEHQFAWKVLGAALKQIGKINESLAASQKSVQLEPKDTEALYNLGNTLKALGRLDEAETSYRKAIVLKPDYATAHNNLGNTLKALGRLDDAETSYRQAIVLKPDYAGAHNSLGNTLQQQGRLDEAETSYRRAIVLKPDYAEAHNSLGNTLKALGRLDEAETSYRQAIVLKPDYAGAHNSLGVLHHELGRLEEAMSNYTKAIVLKPDYAEAHNNLGVLLQELGRLNEVEASYRKAIVLKPDFTEAHNNLGSILQELGRLNEAEASYRKAIVLKPDYAEAHRCLASIQRFDYQNEQYIKMRELYLDKNLSEEELCHINFGLAKACEDLEDFEKAYQHYREGNKMRKKFLNYDISEDTELFKQLKNNHIRIKQNSLKPESFTNKLRPIFIIGMPRSGTTLVEQIISSHSEVTGAGELKFVGEFGRSIAQGLSDANTHALHDFREKYLIKLQNFSNGNLIVTDKMPENFLYIGLLAAAFPEAKIVHVKRNTAAVCWSNYKNYFVSKKLGYSYSLDDVISYYRLYENLMKFWENSLTKRIYNLDYEILTTNQENETRILIDYLGLDWDKDCLSPQDNRRGVTTASNIQIRKEVYQGSSGQWKKYKPFLNGTLDCLDDSIKT